MKLPLKTRISLGDRVFDTSNALLMLALMVVTLYPFLYVLFASFSDPAELIDHRGLLLIPAGFSLESYKFVFENPMISIGYLNTLIYVIVGTALNLAAYELRRICVVPQRRAVRRADHVRHRVYDVFLRRIDSDLFEYEKLGSARHQVGYDSAVGDQYVESARHAHVFRGHSGRA